MYVKRQILFRTKMQTAHKTSWSSRGHDNGQEGCSQNFLH